MKRILSLTFTWGILSFILVSCGPSKSDYYKLLNQNEILSSENERLKKELEKQKETKIEDNIQKIGRWRDVRPGADQSMILTKNLKTGKYYFTCTFGDGSSSKEEVRVTEEKGLMRFQELNSDHIEWYIIEKNGDLSMYGQSGKFGTALCY